MSDSFWGNIAIGGKLQRTSVAALLHAIYADGPNLSDNQTSFQPGNAQDLLDNLVNGHLAMTDEQAPYGEFKEIEAVCVRLGLTFIRFSDARYEYDAETVWFDPEKDTTPNSHICTKNGQLVVHQNEITDQIDMLHNLVGRYERIVKVCDTSLERQSSERDFVDLKSLLSLLRPVANKLRKKMIKLPAIPDLVIVDNPFYGIGPYFRVEYDINFYDGDYSGTGDFIYFSAEELKNSNAKQLFSDYTGIDPVHIIHYTVDELYDANGEIVEN